MSVCIRLSAAEVMPSRTRIWIVLFCASLVLFVTTAEAAHFHFESPSQNQHSKNNHGSCLICHVAHSPVLGAAVLFCPVPVLVEEAAPWFDPQHRAHPDTLNRYVRPPPSI
jgi:hypothetical protein